MYANDAKACCDQLDDLRTRLENALSDKVIAEAQIAALQDKALAEVGENATIQRLRAEIAALASKEEGFRTTIREISRDALEREKSLSAKCAKIHADYLKVMVERDAFRRDLATIAKPREAWMPKPPQNLRQDIIRAINCRNAESGSDTPDWILGNFLIASLAAFDSATNERTSYFRQPEDVPMMDLPTTTEG